MNAVPTNYRGIELVNIPSGMGGALPAAVASEDAEELRVICLHPEYFTDWVLTVKRSEVTPMTYPLNSAMKAIIDKRRAA